MASDGGSMELKQLCCYFHVGGNFKSNPEGIAQYIGGYVKMRNIKEGIKLESLREMIVSWLGWIVIIVISNIPLCLMRRC